MAGGAGGLARASEMEGGEGSTVGEVGMVNKNESVCFLFTIDSSVR